MKKKRLCPLTDVRRCRERSHFLRTCSDDRKFPSRGKTQSAPPYESARSVFPYFSVDYSVERHADARAALLESREMLPRGGARETPRLLYRTTTQGSPEFPFVLSNHAYAARIGLAARSGIRKPGRRRRPTVQPRLHGRQGDRFAAFTGGHFLPNRRLRRCPPRICFVFRSSPL